MHSTWKQLNVAKKSLDKERLKSIFEYEFATFRPFRDDRSFVRKAFLGKVS